jgi:UDP-N-acetylglucosamine 4,6-dehydratase/5-epimerase
LAGMRVQEEPNKRAHGKEVSALNELDGATVLITGGTGSFGSTMARRLLERDIGQVRIFSRDEVKQDDLRRSLNDNRAMFYIGDVRDRASVEDAIGGVDYVFHAAALKQVPSCEFFPTQAVATNIMGSSNVIEAGAAAGVNSIVVLSTDKAVYPINAMGMTKALMEKTAQAFARNHPESKTSVSIVRYGNVMMSRGSVIPLFREQISSGLPLTLTDPDMTRFLMSLDDAVGLVEYAFMHAESGDLFVRKSPAGTVRDLAKVVSKIEGVTPEIKVIGTRHGEKLFETLLSREEMVRATDEGSFFRVRLDARSLDYGLFFDQGGEKISDQDDFTSHNAIRLDEAGISELLMALPEFAGTQNE